MSIKLRICVGWKLSCQNYGFREINWLSETPFPSDFKRREIKKIYFLNNFCKLHFPNLSFFQFSVIVHLRNENHLSTISRPLKEVICIPRRLFAVALDWICFEKVFQIGKSSITRCWAVWWSLAEILLKVQRRLQQKKHILKVISRYNFVEWTVSLQHIRQVCKQICKK